MNRFAWALFLIILSVGLYLRFWNIEYILGFGWDQARDSWMVKDILGGKLSLIGPKTGIGSFHLGPVYYYLLTPFFYLTKLDPSALNYFNILANIVNFSVLFYVSKKIFNLKAAFFVILIYATSSYLMGSRIPWNVTLMPAVSTLIFYSIHMVYKGDYRWVFAAWTLAGFFFNFHFTAIFLPPIIALSFIFVKNKKKVIKYSLLSIPLYFIWFVPNIVYELQRGGSDYYKYREFIQYYLLDFYFRFFLHRLPDGFIQFAAIVNTPKIFFLRFIIPLVFVAIAFFNKKDRVFAYHTMLWFIIPLIGFTLYSGPISDYYFIFNAPMVLFVLWYIQSKIKYRSLILLLAIFWIFYIFQNTKGEWIKNPREGSLYEQKQEALEKVKREEKIEYNEGDIKAYLYEIWTK